MKREIAYHIVFWIFYLLLWSAQDYVYYNRYFAVFSKNVITLPALLAVVYLNLNFLMPNYLFNKKYGGYALLLFLSIGVFTYLHTLSHYAYFGILLNNTTMGGFYSSMEGVVASLTEVLVLVGLSMSLALLRERYKREKAFEEMQKNKLEMELKLLKEQMNPHFLFNSLNSIYVMLDKNLTTGRNMLLRFSDILSHQLYEVSKNRIPLGKELDHIKNYVEIESVRHSDLAKIITNIMDYSGDLSISPMILLPIIENAFKHSPANEAYYIKIGIGLKKENQLTLSTENSCGPLQKTNTTGIGIANVRRRLELIYPKKHELKISADTVKFTVTLKIQLDD